MAPGLICGGYWQVNSQRSIFCIVDPKIVAIFSREYTMHNTQYKTHPEGEKICGPESCSVAICLKTHDLYIMVLASENENYI